MWKTIPGSRVSRWSIASAFVPFCVLLSALPVVSAGSPELNDDVLSDIARFADHLMEHARDRYGPKATPLFVSQFDVQNGSLPPAESTLYASGGRGGAGPTTCNLQFDSGLLRLLHALTAVTGKSRYAAAADEYLRYYLEHLPDEQTGFFPWGDHRGYDVVSDELVRGAHEFKVTFPPWDIMYRVDPGAVTRQIEALRRHVIDPERSWGFNRHYPPGSLPHSMNSSGGAYIAAWAFLYSETAEKKYLDWAHGMADYLWNVRSPQTDLLAAHPFDPAYPAAADSARAMARAGRTEYMGQITWFAPNLLQAARLVGPVDGKKFRDQALAYYRAFIKRMHIQPDGSFFATFDLKTGEPLLPRIGNGWNYHAQRSPPPNSWSTGVVGIRALFSFGFGYRATAAPELREAFDRLRPLAELDAFRVGEAPTGSGEGGKPTSGDETGGPGQSEPPKPVAAGLLAQVMVGFLDMYQATGQRRYLDDALVLAQYAITHYHRDGWFACGPPVVPRYRDPRVDVWSTYSNRGGSDDLALAVLRVWLAERGREDVAVSDPGCHF